MKENDELEKSTKKKWIIHLKINDNVFWVLWWSIVAITLITLKIIGCIQ